MPLASHRSESRKRAEAAAATRNDAKRRQRLSLPSTIESTTSVNEEKARRRLSMRRQSSNQSLEPKENNVPNHAPKSPGPTPYWKVIKERGNGPSPPLTRSQRKPPRKESNTVVLNFSPPNQTENERRERELNAMKQRARANRIEQARQNGQLLVFSPTNRELPLDQDHEGKSVDVQESQNSSEQSVNASSLSDSHHQSYDTELFKNIMAKLDQKLDSVGTADKELFQMKINVLNEKATSLEREKAKLEDEFKQVHKDLATEKESHLVEKTRLESQLEAAQRESNLRVSMLEEAREQLQEQFKEMNREKSQLLAKITNLEHQSTDASMKLEESKRTLEALRRDNASEKAQMAGDSAKLQEINANLSQEIECLKKASQDNDVKLESYQARIAELEAQVSESKDNVDQLEQQLHDKEIEMEQMQTVIEQLKNELVALNDENEKERLHFQQLNADSNQAFEVMQKKQSEKDQKIGELFKQMGELRQKMDEEQQFHRVALEKMQEQEEMNKERVAELNQALEEAMEQLDHVEQAKKTLESKLEQLVSEHNAELAEMKEAFQTEVQSKDEIMEQLERVECAKKDLEARVEQGLYVQSSKVTELQESLEVERKSKEQALRRIQHLEKLLDENGDESQKRIRALEKERDDALIHVQGFNEREQELYRRLQESDRIRRSLHGRVMQLMGNIRVFVRVRPPLAEELEKERLAAEQEDCKKRKRTEKKDDLPLFNFPGIYDRHAKKPANTTDDDISKNIIEVTEPYKDRGGLSERRKKWRFGFDNVFSPEHGQEDIWEATDPLIQSTIDGYNVTIFAYGQTGAGKTYTMLGGEGSEGIIGRSVKKLFAAKREIEELSKGKSEVYLSVELLEVYNEQVRDLLATNSGPNGREIPLKVTSREVVGNIVVATSTEEEVMKVLALAQRRRCVKATSSNAESSRSHMLFTIHFSVTQKDGMKRAGKLNICDLAGSERLNKSEAHSVGGALLEETKHINKSLSTLSNVIERLQAGDVIIPFRESKLTFLLQNSLGGNSKTLAIICCNPLESHFHETICSLRFAEKVNKVDLKKAVANFSC